ncbi:unnamed protein product [Prorocentrum cordatum]|uniref:PDZ domain-containing protein n=1 Tax=Prorocentrum cordatum TaxID=2364126 RepID=A0ABN9U182_9DINO|nr:unnamed protein product [Polarella glacialis]
MATSSELGTDWQRSAGDFSCSSCGRKRLPASEFSKKQVEKALESLRTIPDKDIRQGPEIQQVVYLSGICKRCTEEKEATERAEAQAKREQREESIAEAEAAMGPPERVEVSLGERPFGMTPSKAEGAGYLVVKVSDGKPAARAGVRLGWRVVEVAGAACGSASMEDTQAMLKAAELPASVVFEAPPAGAEFCTACHRVLAAPHFSRKMRTRPPERRRCTPCVEASEADAGAEGDGAEAEAAPPQAAGGPLAELRQLCAETAREAELVTGIRAKGGGGRGGRGRGGRR